MIETIPLWQFLRATADSRQISLVYNNKKFFEGTKKQIKKEWEDLNVSKILVGETKDMLIIERSEGELH